MRVVAAQPLRSWKFAPELAQSRKNLIGTRHAPHRHCALIHPQVDLVALFQPKLANKLRGKTDRKGIAPLGYLHDDLQKGYTEL
jgi:hypothetical protein